MNKIAAFIKENRKAAGLTQEEFAARSGLGLRFIRELEQGKEEYRIVKEADARAGSIIESAKADIRVEREQTMSALQSEIAGLAMTAAAKIVAEQTGNNQEIYDKFLEEVGEAHEDTDNN